uniref:Uncharacterized protein n=1 Tax=Knipowitschia caucasica TaxID=637954 RepID=A0AAV2JET8_KNICA
MVWFLCSDHGFGSSVFQSDLGLVPLCFRLIMGLVLCVSV